MAADPDAMWKPGWVADADAPHADRHRPAGVEHEPSAVERHVEYEPVGVQRPLVRPIEVEIEVVETDVPDRSPRRAGPTLVGAAVGVALLALVAVVVVVVSPGGGGRPEVGAIGAADRRRIPATVEQRWSTRIPGTGSAVATDLAFVGDESVIVVVDDGSRDRAGVVALDARTGGIRWRRSFAFAPPEVRVLGVFDEHLLLERIDPAGRGLFALATADGATAWQLDAQESASYPLLDGSALPVRIVFDPDPDAGSPSAGGADVPERTEFIDPASGEVLGSLRGVPLSTDLSGTFYFGDEEGIVAVDVGEGWSDPVPVSPTGLGASERLVVIGDRILLPGPQGTVSELGGGAPFGVRSELGGTADALPVLDSVFPAGGSTFVGVGRGVIVGARLDGDVIRRTWRLDASLRGFAITERGLVLSLSEATAGFVDGAELVVVDAVTGERLAASGPAPQADQLPLIVGDGFVITRATLDGRERIGYDLAGTELWRLPVDGTLRVGDGVLATLTNTSSGFVVALYGPAGAVGPTAAGTVDGDE